MSQYISFFGPINLADCPKCEGGNFKKSVKRRPSEDQSGLSFHIMCRVDGYCIDSSFSFIIFNFELDNWQSAPRSNFYWKGEGRKLQTPPFGCWERVTFTVSIELTRGEVPVSDNANAMEVAILIPLFLYKNPLQTWLQMIASVQRHLLSSLFLHFSSPIPSMNLLYSCVSWWIPI